LVIYVDDDDDEDFRVKKNQGDIERVREAPKQNKTNKKKKKKIPTEKNNKKK